MTPVFDEYIKFLTDKGCTYPLRGGYYWYDKSIIKAFDNEGNIHKILRIIISDSMSITFKYYKNKSFQIESWRETVCRQNNRLNELEADSIELVQKVYNEYKDYIPYVLTSTGKDSSIVEHIVKKIDNNVTMVFNNTSLDCADTYRMVNKNKDWVITNPKEGFYNFIQRMNYIPTRFSRGCCTIYKEGNMINAFNHIDKAIWFMGVRNSESAVRSKRKDIGKNPKWGNRNWIYVNVIRKWSDLDVWLYIIKNDIEVNPKYKKGYQRVGCAIACPYYNKSTWVLDTYWYPKMSERWRYILKNHFVNNQSWTRLNCTLNEFYTCWNGGLIRTEPNEEVLSEFMAYKGLTDKNVAAKYFNKTCDCCGRNVRHSDDIALNLKLLGRETEIYYCKKHLKEKFDLSNDDYEKMIEGFKAQGCELF